MATLKDLLDSGMSRDEINALLSQGTVGTAGFDGSGFEQPMPQPDYRDARDLGAMSTGGRLPQQQQTMAQFFAKDQPAQPEQQPQTMAQFFANPQPEQPREQPAPLPKNYVQMGNNAPIDLGQSRRTHDVYRDGPQVLKEFQNPDGTIERFVKKPTTDGFGRQSTVVIRETVTPDYLNPAKLKEMEFKKKSAELAQLQAKPQSALDAARAKVLAEIEGDQLKAKVAGTPEYERIQKHAAEKETENTRRDNAVSSAVGVLENINNARGKVGWASTGLIGQGLRNIGGTDALSLDEALEPVRASLSFDRLQRMREESKTGGALGQVAVQELNMLQKSMASLNTAQNEKDLNRSLDVVQKHYSNYISAMQQARANGEFSGRTSAKSGAEQQAMLMQEAQKAIAAGASREAVMQRLQEMMR